MDRATKEHLTVCHPRCSFLGLPREIRDLIYEASDMLPSGLRLVARYSHHDAVQLPFFEICRQMREEALDFIGRRNTIVLAFNWGPSDKFYRKDIGTLNRPSFHLDPSGLSRSVGCATEMLPYVRSLDIEVHANYYFPLWKSGLPNSLRQRFCQLQQVMIIHTRTWGGPEISENICELAHMFKEIPTVRLIRLQPSPFIQPGQTWRRLENPLFGRLQHSSIIEPGLILEHMKKREKSDPSHKGWTPRVGESSGRRFEVVCHGLDCSTKCRGLEESIDCAWKLDRRYAFIDLGYASMDFVELKLRCLGWTWYQQGYWKDKHVTCSPDKPHAGEGSHE
ncbi:hypothetical protein K456DRAFT_1320928 [Colletotrichum gloeosporioides 23]|nr:hypothetical protein K456DRAFT_1320928 [Colletotrichum gloeosporioides 23]